MVNLFQNIIVIISAVGILVSLLLQLLGIKPKRPGLMMT